MDDNTNLKLLENNSNKATINFDHHESLEIRTKEIYKCVLTGTFTEKHILNKCNIVLSKAEKFNSINGNLETVDIKDSKFTESNFQNTKFDNSSIINSFFTNVVFNNCSFYFVSITGTYFESVVFENCNLNNMVIESCKFFDCKFINCHTSNKLMEQSLLFNSTFLNTEIELDTIINNFGLSCEQFNNSKIRKISEYPNYNYISTIDLGNILREDYLLDVEKFKIEYFLNSNIFFEGSDLLDSIFKIENWLLVSEAHETTFSNNLNLFYDFLCFNYEHNKMAIWPLLRYHHLTGLLSKIIRRNSALHNTHYPVLMGIHMALSRYMELFCYLVEEYVKLQSNPLVFLVEAGPLDKSYYRSLLNPLFTNSDIEIMKIVKHNSPNELFIQCLDVVNCLTPITALFLATRVKLDIRDISDNVLNKITEKIHPHLPIKKDTQENHLSEIEIINRKSELSQDIKIKVAFPDEKNDLFIALNLDHNSKATCLVGKTLIKILN
jgi:hypothetical protein